jgi:ADP-heptose:LPS heptosyltransferase
VFTTPAVRAIRTRFPDAHLAYVVEPAAEPVVTGSPHIDEVIVAPRARGLAGIRAELALVGRLRRGAFDLAIDFHGGPRASLLTWLSGAPIRVGYDVAGRGWMYTRRVHRPRVLRARHGVLNQWDLLEPLGIAPPDPETCPVEMPVQGAAAASTAARLASAGVRPGDQVVVMHVSAGNPFRRWPLDAFADVASAIAGAHEQRRVAVTSGPSEHRAAERVIAVARDRLPPAEATRVLDCGDFSLAELRALVDRAALFIGGDSGPLHVAATSHVPIVGLYGPTLPARSAPWRAATWPSEAVETEGLPCRPCEQRVCVPGDFRCLTWIQPADVVRAAERLLGRGKMEPAASPDSVSRHR